MSKNRKYSYWIIGLIVFIIILSIIPWEDVIPDSPYERFLKESGTMADKHPH